MLFIYSAIAIALDRPEYESSVDIRLPKAFVKELGSYSNVYISGISTYRNGGAAPQNQFASTVNLTNPYGNYKNGSFFKMTVPYFALSVSLIAVNKNDKKSCKSSFAPVTLNPYEAHIEISDCASQINSDTDYINVERDLKSIASKYKVRQLSW